ncbi:hypothetical protein SAMN05661096_01246 [Marivirga sericea]|uniref:PH domain-containing protein n=2 Tax=Marivirga sericea TaxID=1028 RepID=A0A1X7J2S3_9BACT|nr:hypothetical protein SAMN05661096_01246 [Marivirga sericea]
MPIFMLISIPIAYYLKGYSWEESFIVGPLFNIGMFVVLGCLPTLIIHISHYWNSKDLRVFIDDEAGKITIDQDQTYQYNLESLEFTEHLALSKKRNEDGKFRILTPWSNYSYIKIKTEDNQEFTISSIVISTEDFPFEVNQKKYTLWPAIY